MTARLTAWLAALIFGLSLTLIAHSAGAIGTDNYSVQASATVQKSPAQIKLTWPSDPSAAGYTIYRKSGAATSWGSTVATLSGAATGYTDNSINVGLAYEYRIVKSGLETSTSTRFTGYGYIYSGIEVAPTESRGKVILVVDNSHASALAAELTRLEQDLIGDGWTVLRHDVARTASARTVKNLIKSDYNADPNKVKAVFLFGHIAVPYSGNLNPDGHSDHRGAWPADAFYGDMDDAAWTDSTVNSNTALRVENRNIPGDGKFDPSSLPSDVELQVGRVDLANMPVFPKSEVELLRQYLNKDHAFRHQLAPFDAIQRRALLDDKFGPSNGNAFAATGWRNFAAFFGADNIHIDRNFDTDTTYDWFPRLRNNSYLWAYGAAGGTFTSAGNAAEGGAAQTGIGQTGPGSTTNPSKVFPALYNFVETDTQVVFTMLFGSYFGDWDSKNNFLRAPLATRYGLTAAWAGRPHWFLHHMGLGENIGYSTRLTQNNTTLHSNQVNTPARGVHIALMGDPTLRMHPVAPVSGLLGTATSLGIKLSWIASPDNVQGYHVYRASTPQGPFIRLTNSLITSTSFTDTDLLSGKYTYMVRAVKLENSASGSYFNPSQGIFQTVDATLSGGTLQFSTSSYRIREGAPSKAALITVTRSGSTSDAVSVNYATSNGSAVAGTDYIASNGTLSFASGETSKTFSLALIDDKLAEQGETVDLTLSNPSGGVTLDIPSSATLTIWNDDAELQFSVTDYSVKEGARSATITVTRTRSAVGAVSVNYATSNGTAIARSDYTTKSGTLLFADGDNTAKTFTVPIVNDWAVEPNETINLLLSNPIGNAALGANSKAVLRIMNDDVKR